jgi:dephospho-CoA kinase
VLPLAARRPRCVCWSRALTAQRTQVAVLSADEVVHQLYAPGGAAVGPVGAAFPSAVAVGAPGGAAGGGAAGPAPASSSGQGGAAGQRYVDRGRLSAAVVGNEAAMKQLEAIVHPLVEQARVAFVQQVRA